MAINRTNQPVYLRQAYGPGAYAVSGGTISSFTSTGANPRDAVGATYRVHTFTSTGTTTITFEKSGFIDVLLVAGGGSGGRGYNTGFGGGGGAGGVLETYSYGIDAGSYSLTVPVGGIVHNGISTSADVQGKNAVFHSLIAFGGGCGGSGVDNQSGQSGGCGGGSNGYYSAYGNYGPGSGITNQGFNGGNSTHAGGVAGGGGGAGGAAPNTTSGAVRGDGGIGRLVAFDSNTAQYYAGGGQGGNYQGFNNGGGLGGGGNATGGNGTVGGNASFYGGGGAGGTSSTTTAIAGGSGFQGLVIIRYRIS